MSKQQAEKTALARTKTDSRGRVFKVLETELGFIVTWIGSATWRKFV